MIKKTIYLLSLSSSSIYYGIQV